MPCTACDNAARAAADAHAEANSDRLTGHGRQRHGRDASRRNRQAAESRDDRIARAWDQIYNQAVNRLMRDCPNCSSG